MIKIQQILVVMMLMVISSVSAAHEGLHAAGQMHAGEHHMGLFEVAVAVIAIVLFLYGLLKSNKSKK